MRLRTDELNPPPGLAPTLRMVACAFGSELPDGWYYPLLCLLSPNFSFRQGAPFCLSICAAQNTRTLTTICWAQIPAFFCNCDASALAAVEARLRARGY